MAASVPARATRGRDAGAGVAGDGRATVAGSAIVVCALGDLLLDVVVRLAAPLADGADAPATMTVGAGGQAANTAAWVAHLGGRARFIGVRSTDPAGRLAAEDLAARGVEIVGPVSADGSGTVVALVGADGQRTMATDRGAATALRPEDLDPAWLDGCRWLHLSGYSLMRSPIDRAAAAAARAARAGGARISVDLSSWSAMRDAGVDLFAERLAGIAPDLVFANEEEVAALGGPPAVPVLVTKRGPAGCSVTGGGEPLDLPATPAAVVDTTGAGDAFAAGYLTGEGREDGARRGLAAAARCVARAGAMP
jgi:sugar/nucleoside kinase (ribokinase family)